MHFVRAGVRFLFLKMFDPWGQPWGPVEAEGRPLVAVVVIVVVVVWHRVESEVQHLAS